MPSFFTSSTPKKPTPVFAGIDDPFNFPASRMKYKPRTTSRTSSPDSSATDSGYGSIDSSDNDTPLSPKSAPARHKRRLQRDSKGHWRTHSYEYQSEDNDASAERTPILRDPVAVQGPKAPDNDHAWKPNLKHTFTLIVDETKPKKEKWFAKRVYGRALRQKERSEGLTQLQRDMAPVLRRAPLSPDANLSLHNHRHKNASSSNSSSSGVVRPVYGGRKQSTLLHPSAPPSFPFPPKSEKSTIRLVTATSTSTSTDNDAAAPRGRARKPSTLLHPSPPPKDLPSLPAAGLRSPRHRSPTPLAIPEDSEGQPAPTPLRIHINRRSVLHSCFSDSEDEGGDALVDENEEEGSGGEEGEEEGEEEDEAESECDRYSVASIETAAGARNGMILARTAVVAQAQRVRVINGSSTNLSNNSGCGVEGKGKGKAMMWQKRSSDLIPRGNEPVPR